MGEKPYDKNSIQDILQYSSLLEGRKFVDILTDNFSEMQLEDKKKYYDNPRSKGGLGQLLEEHYFKYELNSDSNPDFAEVGMELKTTPYETTKTGIRAGERLVITMIPNDKPVEENFYGSHLENKLKLILMIWYNRIKSLSRTESSIDYVYLYNLYHKSFVQDLQIILEDYNIIIKKIMSGEAHKLSEGDTRYLGACTKGATAEKSLQPQYYNNEIPAKRRAFSLKQSYMSYLLNTYVKNDEIRYDSILGINQESDKKFDDIVLDKINKKRGCFEEELYKEYEINPTAKNRNNILVNRMLGVKTNYVEEFVKANIEVKTIRVQNNGSPKEHMSFPAIKIMEMIGCDFEESPEYQWFETTRYLFVVFREDNKTGEFYLCGAKFWSMPIDLLDTVGRREWQAYKDKFIDGVNFRKVTQKNGKVIIENDLPKQKDHQIFHLRPHASKSAYEFAGKRYGNGSDSDMDQLPNGDRMTKQSFWLNKEFIKTIIKDLIGE